MRSLREITADITENYRLYTENSKKYSAEIAEIQSLCPHPQEFLKVDEKHFEDSSYPGVPQYENSAMTVICLLCDKTRTTYYEKDKEKIDPKEVISKE